MEIWIRYGLVAAIIVAISDLLRKYLVKSMNPQLTILLPLSIAGILSLIILMGKNFKNDIHKLDKSHYCILLGLGLLVPLGHYCITKSLQNVHNPGYAKTIISLNILISLFVSIYIFSESKINNYTIGGTFLVIGGTYIIMNKA